MKTSIASIATIAAALGKLGDPVRSRPALMGRYLERLVFVHDGLLYVVNRYGRSDPSFNGRLEDAQREFTGLLRAAGIAAGELRYIDQPDYSRQQGRLQVVIPGTRGTDHPLDFTFVL